MTTVASPIPVKSALKIMLLWSPILLWYAVVFFFPHSPAIFQGVDRIYDHAAVRWLHQQFLYVGTGNGRFVYLPTMAALFSPAALLPLKSFEIVFRVTSVIAMSSGIYYFSRYIAIIDAKRAFFIMLLSTVLLSQGAFFQGQLHILTTGIMLLGYVAIVREKFWQSAAWLTLAVALKPTSLVLYLLAAGLYPQKLIARLIVCGVIAYLSSFFLQSPHYVIAQYHAFVKSFEVDMQYDATHAGHWATLFGAIAFYTHHAVKGVVQFGVRLAAAFGLWVILWRVKLKADPKTLIYFLLTAGMCYLMLFNSRTENNDYVMLAPMMGYSLFLAMRDQKIISAICLGLGIFLLAMNWDISKLMTPENNVWLSPSVVFIYFIYLLRQCLNQRATGSIH